MFALNVTSAAHRSQAIDALVGSITHWNTSYIAGIVGMRFIHEALSDAGRGDLALQLIGRNSSACSGTISCTFSQWLERGPGTLWEQWDWTQVWTGSSLDHIMFGGGPGIFIHKAAGLSEWRLNDFELSEALTEIHFELDGSISKHLGGANLWKEDERGEVMFGWRRSLHSPCLNVQILGPVPSRGRSSWQVILPVELLGTANNISSLAVEPSIGGSVEHSRVSGNRWLLTPTEGIWHEFQVCAKFK